MLLDCSSIISCGKGFWFIDSRYPILFFYNMDNEKTNMLCRLPVYRKSVFYYKILVQYKNEIFCIPYTLNNILVFNIDTQEIDEIDVVSYAEKMGALLISQQNVFADAKIYNGKLILIGASCESIIVIDAVTHEIEYVDTQIYLNLKDGCNKKDVAFREDNVILGSKLYAPSFSTNKLLVFDMTTYLGELKDIETSTNGFIGCGCLDERLYLIERQGHIHIYDCNKKNLDGEIFVQNKEDAGRIYSFNNKIVFFKQSSSDCLVINANQKVSAERICREEREICMARYPFVYKYSDDSCIFFDRTDYLLKIVTGEGKITSYRIEFNDAKLKSYLKTDFWGNENEECSLVDYLKYIIG